MQLERILQSQGFGSRKQCRALIRHGLVAIGAEVCADPFIELEPQGLEFSVDGEPWRYREHAYVMLHKPQGYECSRAPRHHPSVFSLLPEPLVGRAVQSVGRLDEDTTGLLLLTDDGQFIHALTSPKRKVPKIYAVTTKHPVDAAQLAALRRGVQLHDEPRPIAAAACERIDDHLIHLTLIEGKYHQVKRMLAAAGNRVEALRRIAIGGLVLPDDMAAGEWRWLEPADLDRLWQHA
ncbi:ribosomal small subunit pseudouridine synthase A [Sulfuritortus calidifontis]|uniref:Pseudouridine synthase n=1 Tax=Sulfuritortus calidifontis TaxID=1914471 RepID=A0A4R3JQ80_9PROT|nr:16S rRNA pseudouridine(516) synthase [Sulfuritortus calidifontis]TCS69014.1 ribosomal small subunit pseudouridine synthase A [Sulfuritortus calidifontis]